eukprot:Skav225885  [mRNA]  locus=scaffold1460:19017:19397:- [translate_table: standard]
MARLAALCVLVAGACLLNSMAFVPAPESRARDTASLAAAAGVMAIGAPQNAEAFVFKGKEYFDVFYGIDPLAWAFAGFAIVYYGASLKNAATKYNIPVDKSISPKVGGFQGKEIENNEDMEKFYKA